MAKYLTNKATQAELEKLIKNAKKTLVLISPYIKLTNTLLARIKACGEKGVQVKIVFRKGKIDLSEFSKLKTIPNTELKAIEDLHSKCYFNEQTLIITSLNLLETSEKNWEMGVLVDKEEDKDLYEDAVQESRDIYKEAKLQNEEDFKKTASTNSIPKKKSSSYASFIELSEDDDFNEDEQFCEECGCEIDVNPNKHLCYDCWKEEQNSDDEQYCEECGCQIEFNPNKPLCYDCWKEENY